MADETTVEETPTAIEVFEKALAEGDSTQTPPLGADTEAVTPAPDDTPTVAVVDGKVKLGDDEYDLETLAGLIAAGKDADELKKASTQRFQQAADAKREAEVLVAQHHQLSELGKHLAKLPPDRQEELFGVAKKMDEEIAGGGATTPSVLDSMAAFKLPDDFKPYDWSELSEEAQSVVAMFLPALQELRDLRAQVAKVGEVLPDLTTMVKGTRQQQQVVDAAATLSTTYGADIKPEAVALAMKATGLKDPEHAWLKANAVNMAQAAAAKALENKGNKPIETPTGAAKTFDPKGMTADQIFKNVLAGMEPQTA